MWLQHAPTQAEAKQDVPIGTRVARGIDGYEYMYVQAAEDLRVGEFVAIDEQYRATRVKGASVGCVGAVTSDITPFQCGWVMVSGRTDVYMVNYPWVGKGYDIHGVAAL